MNIKTIEALHTMERRLHQIDEELQSENLATNIKKMTELNKERANLQPVVTKFEEYQKIDNSLKAAKKGLEEEKDKELLELLKMEIETDTLELEEIQSTIEEMLIPKDPNDDKNVIVEIRGAAGGDEANIFAGDLYRMYKLYAEKVG